MPRCEGQSGKEENERGEKEHRTAVTLPCDGLKATPFAKHTAFSSDGNVAVSNSTATAATSEKTGFKSDTLHCDCANNATASRQAAPMNKTRLGARTMPAMNCFMMDGGKLRIMEEIKSRNLGDLRELELSLTQEPHGPVRLVDLNFTFIIVIIIIAA